MVGPSFLGMSLFPSVPILHPLRLSSSLPVACCLPDWADSSPPTHLYPYPWFLPWLTSCLLQEMTRCPALLPALSSPALPEVFSMACNPSLPEPQPPTKYIPLIYLLVELKGQTLTQSYPWVWGDKAGQPLRGLEGNPLSPLHQGTPRAGVWLSKITRPRPADWGVRVSCQVYIENLC